MSYEKKYNKYKDKYLNLKNLSMIGGANYEKTILLSCNEFNDVVDKLIALDSVNGPINLNSTPIDISSDAYENALPSIDFHERKNCLGAVSEP